MIVPTLASARLSVAAKSAAEPLAIERIVDTLGQLLALPLAGHKRSVAGIVVDDKPVARRVVDAGRRRGHALAEIRIEAGLGIEDSDHQSRARLADGKALLAEVRCKQGVDRLAIVQPLAGVFLRGIADGQKVLAIQPRHRRQLMVALQAEHVGGELTAVALVRREDAESAAEEITSRP
jgi:hypothetical protein